MAKKGRIRKQFRKRLCSYLEAQGRRADEGAPSLDVRLSFWLMEHFISIPSKRRKRAKGAWDSASFDTACRSHVPMAGVDGEGRITDQRQFPQIPFGRNGNTADHGCGWVSVYNSLLLMGRHADPSEILSEISRGARSGGRQGVNPFFILKYFRKLGYTASMVTGRERMDRAARDADAFILCYIYKGREYRLGGHFIAGKWQPEKESYLILNGENPEEGETADLFGAISKKTLLSMMIAIREKRSGQAE